MVGAAPLGFKGCGFRFKSIRSFRKAGAPPLVFKGWVFVLNSFDRFSERTVSSGVTLDLGFNRPMPKKISFYQKPTCTTCRKSKAYLEKRGATLELRNLDTERLSASELDQLIGKRDHREFLNTRNELYRSRKMKDNPPTRAETIKLMAETPNLIRRPVTISGSQIILGYDELAFKKLTA
jgi:Spx/MgsR family transcriptional regulator